MNSHKTRHVRLVLLAATTLVVAACSSNDNDYMEPPPPPANTAPSLSGITNKTSNQDTVVGPIEFSVGDRESDPATLVVTAAADGTSVVPADGVVLGGSGAVRNITLTPLEAATGTVNVTLTVTDPQGSASTRSFGVTVNARNASLRDTSLATFAKSVSDDATAVNGFTFAQDVEDSAIYEPLIAAGAGAE
ncbi:MAG TPA: hypothetical protein VFU13_08510 [Steroidobacteraceae bacterium]|nr:hypothetical protein [Steroidobacteraceae bacterium]